MFHQVEGLRGPGITFGDLKGLLGLLKQIFGDETVFSGSFFPSPSQRWGYPPRHVRRRALRVAESGWPNLGSGT